MKTDMTNTDARLRIAVQKSGRLTDNTLALLARAGLKFSRDHDHLVCFGENLPVDLMLVRDDDIPELVADGVCEAGVVGENVAKEYALTRGGAPFDVDCVLDFGRCRLALAAPMDSDVRNVGQLTGLRVATSYPAITRDYLQGAGVKADIVTLKGAVEIAPRLGRADVICDLVSSGRTLHANRLQEIAMVCESLACVIVGNTPLSESKAALLGRMLRRIGAVMQVNESKYVMLHAPRERLAEITRLLPGAEAPTVLPLEGSADKVAVHAVCRESVFWETLENLKDAGASALLVLPVEKMLA